MKTVLSLIGEFGALNDAKVRTGGKLPPEDEKRWAELKAFYEVLMAQTGLDLDREDSPITASDIREQLTDRDRIRVPVEVPVVFQDGEEHHSGKVVNLSRGRYLHSLGASVRGGFAPHRLFTSGREHLGGGAGDRERGGVGHQARSS